MSMRSRHNIWIRAFQAALGSLTAVALMAGIPATAHASDATADFSVVDGEVTNPVMFDEFDADVTVGADFEASGGVWKRYSWKCTSPAGAKFNISIGYRGPLTQKIYFNNHCGQKRSVRMHYKGQEPGGEPEEGSYCEMTVNPGTKGNHSSTPSNYYPWVKATSNC
jgi:hypothetical protein